MKGMMAELIRRVLRKAIMIGERVKRAGGGEVVPEDAPSFAWARFVMARIDAADGNTTRLAALWGLNESTVRRWSLRPGETPQQPTIEQVMRVVKRLKAEELVVLFEMLFGGTQLRAQLVTQRSETGGMDVLLRCSSEVTSRFALIHDRILDLQLGRGWDEGKAMEVAAQVASAGDRARVLQELVRGVMRW